MSQPTSKEQTAYERLFDYTDQIDKILGTDEEVLPAKPITLSIVDVARIVAILGRIRRVGNFLVTPEG